MKVKCESIPDDCTYLEVGKIYDVVNTDDKGGDIMIEIDGVKVKTFILFNNCYHLAGESWTIVEE